MTDRPILFSAPMIRAIAIGAKSQTRRLAKFKPLDGANLHFSGIEPDQYLPGRWNLTARGSGGCWNVRSTDIRTPAVGDRLWVRETWTATGTGIWTIADARRRVSPNQKIVFRADYSPPDASFVEHRGVLQPLKWWPAIHMPREFSRFTLVVTDVRVQRLQEISETDAIAEGVVKVRDHCYVIRGVDYDNVGLCHSIPITPYAKLWDSINDQDGRRWADNPWIFAITFDTHRRNIDAMPRANPSEDAA